MFKELQDEMNQVHTENGAKAFHTTESAVLDYFAVGGAFRNTPDDMQDRLIIKAWAENPELTLKAMFYFRDVRGGQGQRCGFYRQLKWLATNHTDVLKPLVKRIPEYGRWDDLYQLFDTPLQNKALKVMTKQLSKDQDALLKGEKISLLGKWLKSENASSKETKRLARITRQYLSMDSRCYRKMLSNLRGFLDIVERKIAANDWTNIEYGKVPSQAMHIYKRAFWKHDEDGISKFIKDVESGDEKVNVGTLYPAQIIHSVLHGDFDSPAQIDMYWKNLPDYIEGSTENSIAVVDVSMSMSGTPMEVAISLGLYLAERAKGVYANGFITFSESPTFETVIGDTVVDKIRVLKNSKWGYNTNIERVFDAILKVAIIGDISQDEMVDKLYIISDMEFDVANGNSKYGIRGGSEFDIKNEQLMLTIARKFADAGYKMPNLVYWNVDARNEQFPMQMKHGVQFVSGYSPVIFKNLMKGNFLGAYELMLDVLEDDRYNAIKIK